MPPTDVVAGDGAVTVAAATTRHVNVVLFVQFWPSVTVTDTVGLLIAVGVPVTSPLVLMASPAGSPDAVHR